MKRFLFVIDMQKDFVDGSLGSEEARGILPAVAAKIRAFEGERIIVTLDTHFAESYSSTLEGRKLPVPHCFEGTDGHKLDPAVCAALEEKGYVTVKKYTFGALDAINELKNELAYMRPDDIEFEVIGLCTDICVVSNALLLRAFLPETPLSVDAACCAGVTPEKHLAALETLRSCQVEVV